MVFCSAKLHSRTLKNSRKKGFTLIELVVSLSIFMVFLGIVSTSYLSIIHAQREANSIRKMYSEVRNFMEMLAQDARLGTLDYDCYEHFSDVENIPLDEQCPADILNKNINGVAVSADGTSPFLVLVNKEKTEKTVYWFDDLFPNVYEFLRKINCLVHYKGWPQITPVLDLLWIVTLVPVQSWCAL